MTQVYTLTTNPLAKYELDNALADFKGKPPKGSPYTLSKKHRKLVTYVKGTNFQTVMDLVTGNRISTRKWLEKPEMYCAGWRNAVIEKELEVYLNQIVVLDGVSSVWGLCGKGFTMAKYARNFELDKDVSIDGYLSVVELKVYSGPLPVIYDDYIDHRGSRLVYEGAFRNKHQLITAIADHALEVFRVNP